MRTRIVGGQDSNSRAKSKGMSIGSSQYQVHLALTFLVLYYYIIVCPSLITQIIQGYNIIA